MLCKQSAMQMWTGFSEKSLEGTAGIKRTLLELDALGSNHTIGTYCVYLDTFHQGLSFCLPICQIGIIVSTLLGSDED